MSNLPTAGQWQCLKTSLVTLLSSANPIHFSTAYLRQALHVCLRTGHFFWDYPIKTAHL